MGPVTCEVGGGALGVDVVSAEVSFELFYQGQRDSLVRAVALAVGDRVLAIDAVDEAMARAYARWGKVGSYDNPGGWVYRVAVNWSRSVLTRRARRQAIRDRQPPPQPAKMEVFDPTLAEALNELPADLRATVVCRLVLDWSTEQTATALRVRPGTVKSRLHRGLAQLRARLSGYEETDR